MVEVRTLEDSVVLGFLEGLLLLLSVSIWPGRLLLFGGVLLIVLLHCSPDFRDPNTVRPALRHIPEVNSTLLVVPWVLRPCGLWGCEFGVLGHP